MSRLQGIARRLGRAAMGAVSFAVMGTLLNAAVQTAGMAQDSHEQRYRIVAPTLAVASLSLSQSLIALFQLAPYEDPDQEQNAPSSDRPRRGLTSTGEPRTQATDVAGLAVVLALNLQGDSPEAADTVATGIGALETARRRDEGLVLARAIDLRDADVKHMVCLLYGDDFEGYGALADRFGIGEDDIGSCAEAFGREIDHWSVQLGPFVSGLPDTPEDSKGRFRSRIADGGGEEWQSFKAELTETEFLPRLAELLNEFLIVSSDVTLTALDCGADAQLWTETGGVVALCFSDLLAIAKETQ